MWNKFRSDWKDSEYLVAKSELVLLLTTKSRCISLIPILVRVVVGKLDLNGSLFRNATDKSISITAWRIASKKNRTLKINITIPLVSEEAPAGVKKRVQFSSLGTIYTMTV